METALTCRDPLSAVPTPSSTILQDCEDRVTLPSLMATPARRLPSIADCTSTRYAANPCTGTNEGTDLRAWRTDLNRPPTRRNKTKQHLLENMRKDPSTPIPHLLNATFHSVDTQLSALSAAEGSHSGCTAVTCLLRLEDENGNPVGEGSGVAPHIVGGEKGKLDGKPGEACEAAEAVGIDPTEGKPGSGEGQHPGGAHADLSFASMYCCCFGWILISAKFLTTHRLTPRWQRQEQDQEHALVVGQQAEFAHELHLVYAVEPEPGLWTCRGSQGSEANALHRQRRRCARRPLVRYFTSRLSFAQKPRKLITVFAVTQPRRSRDPLVVRPQGRRCQRDAANRSRRGLHREPASERLLGCDALARRLADEAVCGRLALHDRDDPPRR